MGSRPRRPVVVVVVAGLLIVAAFTWLCQALYNGNETRLLNAKSKEAAAVLTAALPSIQTQLSAGAELAMEPTDAHAFQSYMGSLVGSGKSFSSVSLWKLSDPAAGPSWVVGARPAIASDPSQAATFFARAAGSAEVAINTLRTGDTLHLGYEYHAPGQQVGVYAESALPANRQARIAKDRAFSDLHYAIYLGNGTGPGDVLTTDLSHLPVTGRHSTAFVPFGDSGFTLVVSPRGVLSGTLPRVLPWIVAIAGVVIVLISGYLVDWLNRKRRLAESLAASLDQAARENEHLYAEQQSIARTLQNALIPDKLPDLRGAKAASLYVPGTKGMDIGGDWYDLVLMNGDGAMLVIGDVSGRGVRAAAVMASVRFAALAYVREGHAPPVVLNKLAQMISVEETGHFVTVLCAWLDLEGQKVTFTNAGHLPPLLIEGTEARLLHTTSGPPIGVSSQAEYPAQTVDVLPGATLLAFTDGLVEKRGEVIDASLDRFSNTALRHAHLGLDDLVTTLVEEVTTEGIDDDGAIVGVRWDR